MYKAGDPSDPTNLHPIALTFVVGETLQKIPYSGKVWQGESLAGGKFDEFDESFMIRQTKTIQSSTFN